MYMTLILPPDLKDCKVSPSNPELCFTKLLLLVYSKYGSTILVRYLKCDLFKPNPDMKSVAVIRQLTIPIMN